MSRSRLASALSLALSLAACGDNDSAGLDEYLPDIPDPTGDPQSVYAGVIDEGNAADELIPGDAASGVVGDIYLRNARGRYVIQSADRVIGVVPQGGNLVDAQRVGEDGPIGEDHFGELSAIYIFGRTCEHETVEVVQDGSGGGAAAVIARGKSGVNDFFNLRGLGLLNVPADMDPVIPDEIECATTYVLQPDSPTVEVFWTYYNAGERPVRGPHAAFSDTGGAVDAWARGRGFEKLGFDALTGGASEPIPTEYAVFQGEGIAYGVVPQHAADAPVKTNAALFIVGVSIVLYGADELFDILTEEGRYLDLDGGDGVTYGLHFVTGADAADVEEAVRAAAGDPTHEVAGQVTWASGDPIPGARVSLFEDTDVDGQIGEADVILTFADADEDGRFSAHLAPGSYLARADVFQTGRSAVAQVDLLSDQDGVALEIPDPIYADFTVIDDATDEPVPARLTVVGDNPIPNDPRVFPDDDTRSHVATQLLAWHGSSIENADGADPRLRFVAGGDYRVYATRGTEWSVDSVRVTPEAGDPDADLTLRIRRVVDTDGYLGSEYHVHSIGSPDSTVPWATRVASAAADGLELFASTEHDYVADLQPVVEALGLERLVRVLPGVEITPFAYGHFMAWPLERDDSANGGAIDWARNADGFALAPGEIFDKARERGAELVQVNHPRSVPGALTDFMEYFDRVDLGFDLDARAVVSREPPVPNDWLRLPPGEELLDLDFNALEVWNSAWFDFSDVNGDGAREPNGLDVVMRDWFNFLSLGMEVTPLGNSDTHSQFSDPMGFPRSYVRVEDDSPEALEDGSVVASLLDTLTGRSPRDVFITNGPLVRVTEQGDDASVIGGVVAGAGTAALTVSVQSPRWASFHTIEVFANAVPDVEDEVTTQYPVICFTTIPEADLDPADPCAMAPLGVQPLAIDEVEVAPGFTRYEASVDVTLASDQPIYPDGASGEDMWAVVRVRGDRAIFPVLLGNGVLGGTALATILGGSQSDLDEALEGIGIAAVAFTAPIFLDLDGGGYRAPFEPE